MTIEKDFSDIEAKISSVQKVPAQLPYVDLDGITPPYNLIYINTEFGELVTVYVGYSEEYGCGPFCVSGRAYVASPIQVKIALYIPNAEFLDTSNKRRTLQGFTECPKNETDLSNFQKIKEFPARDTHLASDGNYYITGDMEYNWDGMTDPQFTGGVSKAVFDCVHISFENAETGEKLGGSVREGKFTSGGIVRYSFMIHESIKFTALPNSVKADVWFATGGLPITNVTTFLIDYNCVVPNIKWADFQVSGAQAVTGAGWGESLKAYKSFPVPGEGITLEDAETGLYHISWEIIKPDGKPYDSASSATPDKHILGIVVEGVGPAVNLTGKDGVINTGSEMFVPRPLNATGIKDVKQSDNIQISGFPNGILILTDESTSGICKVYTVTGEEVLQQSFKPIRYHH
ncbi:hypothetical protein FACS189428_6060 [Clostridia bacterium]|nr:hypothetical protein FACS189428_6060 [Clostridia bacterium]